MRPNLELFFANVICIIWCLWRYMLTCHLVKVTVFMEFLEISIHILLALNFLWKKNKLDLKYHKNAMAVFTFGSWPRAWGLKPKKAKWWKIWLNNVVTSRTSWRCTRSKTFIWHRFFDFDGISLIFFVLLNGSLNFGPIFEKVGLKTPKVLSL